jgi:hypothetical protein
VLCALAAGVSGCGGGTSEEAPNPEASKAVQTRPPPAAEVEVTDKKDATGPEKLARKLDVKSVALRREDDTLELQVRFWRPSKEDAVVRFETTSGKERSEVRIVRRDGALAAKRATAQPVEGAEVESRQRQIQARLPLDKVTDRPQFSYRVVVKSGDGKAADSLPEATFPAG